MTINTDERRQRLEADLATKEIPTVADLAGPILRGLLALHDFGGYGFDAGILGYHVEEGDLLEEADKIIALVEGVATAVEMGVASMICEGSHIHAANARAMVLAIFDLEVLRVGRNTITREQMLYGDA